MLAYAYLAEGWDLVPIRSLDDGFASLNDMKKQVFLFDDFLGKVALDKHALAMKDSDLARFIRRVRGSANARFILTTRAYILEEARRVSEHLADQRLDVSKYVLDVGIYTRRIRARILYNHLIVAGTPVGHLRSLIESGKLSKIVDHKNYNPRVVEWMTDRFHIGDIDPSDYPDAFLEALKNPRQLWDTAFRTHIDDRCRHLLFTLFFCSEYGVEIDDARMSYDVLHRTLCDRYGLPRDPKDFEEAVRILEGGFINVSGESLSYINPSFRDYLTEYLDDPAMLRDFAGSSRRSSWAEAVWRHGTRGLPLGSSLPDLAKAFVEVAQNFEKWPTWKRSKSDPRSLSIADSSNASRLSLLLDWGAHSRDPGFASAALSLARDPPDGWDSWRDSEPLIEIISKIRDGGYYDEFPYDEELAGVLEAGMVKMLRTGISSDDLEKVSDAIEEAGRLLSKEVGNAMRDLIAEEFRDIYQRTSEMDSESTLDEHLQTLTKLAPRAGVPQDQISLVTSVVNSSASADTIASSVAYLPFGPLQQLTYGNGLTLTRTFDQNYWQSRVEVKASGTTRLDLSFGRNANGELTGVTDNASSGRGATFGYTNSGRLNAAAGPWGTDAYTYDAAGNRTQKQRTIGGVTATENAVMASTKNRVNLVQDGSSTTLRTLTYNTGGDLAEDNQGTPGDFVYQYNARKRLAVIKKGGTDVGWYGYDAFGRRVWREAFGTSTVQTQYIFDPDGRLLAEHDGATGNVVKEYVWIDDMPVAVIDKSSGMATTYFIHPGQLNEPLVMTDATKAKVWDAYVEPFGAAQVFGTASALIDLRLPGQWLQSEASGLHQNWMRDYDPTLGRYVETDPLGIDAGHNVYTYVDGRPLNATDKAGLFTLSFEPTLSFTLPGTPINISVSGGIVVDDHGNVGITTTTGLPGIGTPGFSFGVSVLASTACTIFDTRARSHRRAQGLGDLPLRCSAETAPTALSLGAGLRLE